MKRALQILLILVATFGCVIPVLAQTTNSGEVAFTSIRVSEADSISLTLTGAVMTTYTILASSDLDKPFSPIGFVSTDQTGSGSFRDLGTLALNSRRFYRAQRTL